MKVKDYTKQIIRQQINSVCKGIDTTNRTVTVAITDESTDRDSDIIRLDGWDFSNYMKNPVILWMHDHKLVPIAHNLELKLMDSAIVAVAQFPQSGKYLLADTIFDAIVDGRIRTVSVGFIPYEAEWMEDGYGIEFLKQELLEYSFVSVPSNPNALIIDNENRKQLKSWAKENRDCDDKILQKQAQFVYDSFKKKRKNEEEITIQLDSFVSCKQGKGIVEQIVSDGEIDGLKGTKEDPAVKCQKIEDTEGGVFITEETFVDSLSKLTLIDPQPIVDPPDNEEDEENEESEEKKSFDNLKNLHEGKTYTLNKDFSWSKGLKIYSEQQIKFNCKELKDSSIMTLTHPDYGDIDVSPLSVILVEPKFKKPENQIKTSQGFDINQLIRKKYNG